MCAFGCVEQYAQQYLLFASLSGIGIVTCLLAAMYLAHRCVGPYVHVCICVSPYVHVCVSMCALLQVLDDFQTDPRAARKHLQNPDIHKKISKLVSAGIIQLR